MNTHTYIGRFVVKRHRDDCLVAGKNASGIASVGNNTVCIGNKTPDCCAAALVHAAHDVLQLLHLLVKRKEGYPQELSKYHRIRSVKIALAKLFVQVRCELGCHVRGAAQQWEGGIRV